MELEKFDAFDEGIEPGGLRSRSEIKILVCYLLKILINPFPKSKSMKLCLKTDWQTTLRLIRL